MAWSVFSRSADGNLETANARNANPAATKLLIQRRGELIGLHDSRVACPSGCRSCRSSLAVDDRAGRGSALQMHAAVCESHALCLKRRDDTMQGARLGVGNAAARSFPSRETRT